jgi:hypothetical protein
MKIAVFSSVNENVSDGINALLDKYALQSPEVHFPVSIKDDEFVQSILDVCIDRKVKTVAYFPNATGLDYLLKQADDLVIVDIPTKELIRQLRTEDAVGIFWTDSPHDHIVLHALEDIAPDIWDITDGLDPIELDDDPFDDMSEKELHDAMHMHLGAFVDLLASFVASTVVASLTEAVIEQISDELGKKDFNPFNDEQ